MTVFGHPHRHFRLTDSTNERARALAAAGAPSGTVVTAAEQTAGRGRRGRSWIAPPRKALLYSAILRPLGPGHGLLPLAVPVAVCEAVEEVAGVDCAIKWPNDVWIGERKLAGVLIEARVPEWAVIGVGANVELDPGEFPGAVRWPAASLGRGVSVDQVRAAVDRALSRWADAGREDILGAFRDRDALAGRQVEWDDGSGIAEGIDGDGNLVVTAPDGGRIALGAGEVSPRLSG